MDKLKVYSWRKLGDAELDWSAIRAYDEYDAAMKAAIEYEVIGNGEPITFEIRDDKTETINRWSVWAEMVMKYYPRETE